MVLTCLPSAEALDDVVQGKQGLVHSARPGQIIVEFGSHLIPDKERQVGPLAEKGAIFIDGEIGGTPTMVTARKAVVYLAGDADAARKLEPVVHGFTDICHYFGPFGSASKVKLVNNLLVAVHIAAAAEAMALGLKTGVDVDLMIKAVGAGSGGSAQFNVRAPWMAQRRFTPAHGNVPGLSHYFELIAALADRAGVATPMLDRAIELYDRCTKMGLGELDHAVMIDVIASMPRKKSKRASKKRKSKVKKAGKKAAKKSKRRR